MTAVAIFVKTPGLSPIKTRLAQTIGQPLAETWHHSAALTVADVAKQAQIGPVYFAVAEPKGQDSPLWGGHACLTQPSGGLGWRMASVHAELIKRHGAGILLGADTPQIEPQALIMAHQWLSAPAPRQVIGPARDGGFWLYGSNHAIAADLWTSVRYSQANTRACFETAMQHQGAWLVLEEKTDLDHAEDMLLVQQALAELATPTDSQRALLVWLKAQTSNSP